MQTIDDQLPGTTASGRYKWGAFQGWVSVILGLALFLPAPFVNVSLATRMAMYVTGALQVFMGLNLVGKKRTGVVLLYVVGAVVIIGSLVSHPRAEVYIIFLGWYGIPAVFYYPKRWKQMK